MPSDIELKFIKKMYLLYLSLALLEGAICTTILLMLPKDPNNDWLWGYSLSRLILVGIALISIFFMAIVALKLWKEQTWFERINRKINKLFSGTYFYILMLVSSLIIIIGMYEIAYTTVLSEPYFKTIFNRLLPLVLWITLLSIQTMIMAELIRDKGLASFLYWLHARLSYIWIFIPAIVLPLCALGLGLFFSSIHPQVLPIQVQNSLEDFHLLTTFWKTFFIQIVIIILLIRYAPKLYKLIGIRPVEIFIQLIFIIGILLIFINMFGILIKTGKALTSTNKTINTQIGNQTAKNKGESNEEYAHRINDLVHQSIANVAPDADGKTILPVPIYENYLLFASDYLTTKGNGFYEFCDYHKALERGIGLCSQKVIIISGILEKNGIPVNIIALDGHVVAEARVDQDQHNIWWILDPDYGVVITHSINEIEIDPKIIRKYYEEKGYSTAVIDNLVSIYMGEGNVKTTSTIAFLGKAKCKFEQYSYILIWLIPVALIFPYVLWRIYILI